MYRKNLSAVVVCVRARILEASYGRSGRQLGIDRGLFQANRGLFQGLK
jgi:hypothetical protein